MYCLRYDIDIEDETKRGINAYLILGKKGLMQLFRVKQE